MRVVPSSLLAAPPKIRTVSPHQALRASFPLRGKPCIEPFSSLLYHSVQDPSTWSLLQGSQKVSKNFLGRGAAGAAGKAANEVRRLPWRLAGDEEEGRLHFAASCAAFATPPAPSCHPAVARYCRAYRRISENLTCPCHFDREGLKARRVEKSCTEQLPVPNTVLYMASP